MKILEQVKYKNRSVEIKNREFLKDIVNDTSIIAFMEERTVMEEENENYEEIVIRFQSKLIRTGEISEYRKME